jgi:uncharacterized repeat protein (TIGR03803 family)
MNKHPIRAASAQAISAFLAASAFTFATALNAAPTVEILHSFGEAGPDACKMIQASDGNLYGTTYSGGSYSNGSVFQYPLGGSANTIYSFTNGADGANPQGNLIQGLDGNLYGTARFGGASSNGTAFRLSTSGAFTVLHTFSGGADGGNPRSGFVLGSDGNLYGTTINGGKGSGTVFKMSTNGTLNTLYSFSGSDGANPHTGLIQGKDGGLYGTTFAGGSKNSGTIFRISLNGVFSSHYSFTGGNDGATPDANLFQANDGNLYGTTIGGGSANYGTIFQIPTNGTSITTLYSFTNGTDGSGPVAGLVQASDGLLYGSAEFGGNYSDGTLFRISTNGAFTELYAFTGGDDGNEPFADMVIASDGNLYGSTFIGGSADSGSLFTMDTSGNFVSAFSFPGAGDGANPHCVLVQAPNGNMYGTGINGGTNGQGAIFSLTTNGNVNTIFSFTGGFSSGAPQSGLVLAPDGSLYGVGTPGSSAGALFRLTTNGAYTLPYVFAGTFDGGGPNQLTLGKDGNIYGTCFGGGSDSLGTVFQYPLPSGPFAVLHTFTGTNDGANPIGGMVQASDGAFYGTTSDLNINSYGTVFKVTADGTFTTLYSFTNGLDGNSPFGALMQAKDGFIYGTTSDYGTGGNGTVFKMSTNGAFTELYSFTGGNDGSEPYGGLVQASDGALYGTTWFGGSAGAGAIFKITTNGTFTALYSFTGGNDGADPGASLIQANDGNLYGTVHYGGIAGEGSVFRVDLASPGSVVAVQILSPNFSAGNLNFSFQTASGQSYTVQHNASLGTSNWVTLTNFTGAGSAFQLAVPATNRNDFFRVREP